MIGSKPKKSEPYSFYERLDVRDFFKTLPRLTGLVFPPYKPGTFLLAIDLNHLDSKPGVKNPSWRRKTPGVLCVPKIGEYQGQIQELMGSDVSWENYDLSSIQESYNTPLEHTPGNPPTQLWNDSLYNPLVKV